MRAPTNRNIVVSLLLVVCFAAPWRAAVAQQRANDKQTIEDVRQAYSMLKHQGLVGLEASVTPVWDYLLASVEQKQKTQILRLLSRLRFTASIEPNQPIKVTHKVIGPSPDKQTKAELDNLAIRVERSTLSFLGGWTPIMLASVIPDKLDSFVLQDLDSEYLLTFKDQGIDTSITISKDLVIKEVRWPMGWMKPSLLKTGKGYLLTGYETSFNLPNFGAGSLSVSVLSQEVAGMSLPSRVTMNTTSAGQSERVELLFTNYQLKTAAPAAKP